MPRSTALRSSTGPVIWLGLAAAIIFFMATGAVAYFNFQTLKADSALVVRSGDTLTALEDVLSTVIFASRNLEQGERVFLSARDRVYGSRSFWRGRAAAAPLFEVNHHQGRESHPSGISDLPDEQQRMIHRARNRDALLEGRRILIVEDDVRNVLFNHKHPRTARSAGADRAKWP
jgi:hypothetical protein